MRRLFVLFLAIGLLLILSANTVIASDQQILVSGYKIINSEPGQTNQEKIKVHNPLDQEVKIKIKIVDWETKTNSEGIDVWPVTGEDTESKFASNYGLSDYENSLYPYMDLPEKTTYTIPANDKIEINFSTHVPSNVEKDCLWTSIMIEQVEPEGERRFAKIIQSNTNAPLEIEVNLERDMERTVGAYFDVVIKNNSNADIFYPINLVFYKPNGEIAELKEDVFRKDITYSTHVPENSTLQLDNKKQLIWTLPPAHIPAKDSLKIQLGLDQKYFKGFKNDWYEFTLKPAFGLEVDWSAETGKFNPQRLIDEY